MFTQTPTRYNIISIGVNIVIINIYNIIVKKDYSIKIVGKSI